MLMLMHVDRAAAKSNKRLSEFPLSWTDDGKAFVIRDRTQLCNAWLPGFFGQAKFSSFTRKLYRWGFRQIKIKLKASQTSKMHFGNEHFQRDDKSLLSHMQSVTAIKNKRQLQRSQDPQLNLVIPSSSVLPDSTMSMVPLLQPQEQLHGLAPYVVPHAFPSVTAPSATQFDMSNTYLQQLLVGAQGPNQFQLAGHFANHESLIPPNTQHQQDLSAQNDYLRQLQQLANATSAQPPMYQMPFQLHAPSMAQMPLQQQPLFAPVQQAQVGDSADQGTNHQQQLLQALQFMLDQSQASDPQNPPSDLPN